MAYKGKRRGISYFNEWLLGSYDYIRQRTPQSYQYMQVLNVIPKTTKPSSRDAIIEGSHKKGTVRLYVMNSH